MWNTLWLYIILTMMSAPCSTRIAPQPSRSATSVQKKVQEGNGPKSPEEKFCNQDYVYGPNETPEITRCLFPDPCTDDGYPAFNPNFKHRCARTI